MIFAQIFLPLGSIHNVGQPIGTGIRPTEAVPPGADVKATSSHLGNRAPVIEAPQHIVKCHLRIVLAVLHQRRGRKDFAAFVRNLGIMNDPFRFRNTGMG